MREQRTIFGEVPELYDKARAPYPDTLVEDVVAHAAGGGVRPPRALEIGAGTGKATVSFAAKGVEVLALEPDEAMAAVARRNCERWPTVHVDVTTFEDWQPSGAGTGSDDETRRHLFEAVAEVIDAHGGEITIPHATFLLRARAK